MTEGKTKKQNKRLTGQTGVVAGASTWPGVQHADLLQRSGLGEGGCHRYISSGEDVV